MKARLVVPDGVTGGVTWFVLTFLQQVSEIMGGPIVRTGTTPKFWENWDKAFGGEDSEKAEPKKKAGKAAKKKSSGKKAAASGAGKKKKKKKSGK